MRTIITIIALAIAAFRPVLLFREFNPHVELGYQAIAHLFVGGLLGAWAFHKFHSEKWYGRPSLAFQRAWLLKLAAFLTVVEIVCAGISIYRKFNQ